MKKLLLCLLALLFCCLGYGQQKAVKKHHNRIDDIESVAQAKFLLHSINSDFDRLEVTEPENSFHDAPELLHLRDSLKIKPYSKADIDGNGYTDLLIVLRDMTDYYLIYLLDSPGKKSKIRIAESKSNENCPITLLKAQGDTTFIYLIYGRRHTSYSLKMQDTIYTRRLVFLENALIEYNSKPINHSIRTIQYNTSQCLGFCPAFSLDINAERYAYYHEDSFPLSRTPKNYFAGRIDTANYNRLLKMLNYIDFPELDNSYEIGWTDNQSCTLTVRYDDNKIKSIYDYGLQGTCGLSIIYDILSDLRTTQHWKPVNK